MPNLDACTVPAGVRHASLRALVAQCAAATVAVLIAAAALFVAGVQPSLPAVALLQGFIALRIAHCMRLPWWWLAISCAFVPALMAALELGIAPGWYMGAFLLMLAIFWSTFRTQVPLYLSSRRVSAALAHLLPSEPDFRFIDLGCGLGGVLEQLAKMRPDGRFQGVELAPLPFLVAWLRACFGSSKVRVRYGDFWSSDLASYDVVYAFLSPVPMAQLWDKVRREMRPGSLFVSNSFAVPGVTPQRVIRIGAAAGSVLHVWRL